MRLHTFKLHMTDDDLEQVFQRYGEIAKMPVNGALVEQIERDLGAQACAAIKIELRLAAALIELNELKELKRGQQA